MTDSWCWYTPAVSRFFLAIELSEEARAELMRVQRVLAKICDGVYKMVTVEQLHLTLYFCGETDEETMNRIGDGIEAWGASGFDVSLAGLKLLPQDDIPRVLGAGVKSAGRELLAFQQRVHDVCFSLAEYKEVRPFAPHVTFARLDRGVPANAKVVKRSVAGVRDEVGSVKWRVREVVVISSEGAEYEVVRRIGLG